MGYYRTYMLPRPTHLAMRQEQLLPYRERPVAVARGRVLEIGVGSGLNLPLYQQAVDWVIGIDPLHGLLRLASGAARELLSETALIESSGRVG